ncbi:MAG: dienelactone hydrolase family protein [Chloroflexi bacterium]|nr:dienelactone hydrolase family protein [Chloroflexota bacterium]
MNELQAYMVHEYVADFKAGHLGRRDLVRRVLNITGGVGTTATLLLALGCSSSAGGGGSAAAATAVKPAAAPAASPGPSPSPGSSPSPSVLPSPSPLPHSPLAVAPNDPTIDGQDITFQGADGATIMAYQARMKGTNGALPLVLVCHQNRGLNEHIRDVVRRFAKEGYIACGVDLVSRQGGTAKISDPNQFSALLTGPNVNADQFVSDFKSAVTYYQSKPDLVQFDKLAMNGFCFGGGVVWRSTTQIPQLRAAAPWYGAPPPLDQVGNIKAAVLGIYSSDPNDFANNGRDQLEQALTAAKVTHQFNVYPGTMHAFNDDTGPAYNQDQALAAWRDMINWFKEHLA